MAELWQSLPVELQDRIVKWTRALLLLWLDRADFCRTRLVSKAFSIKLRREMVIFLRPELVKPRPAPLVQAVIRYVAMALNVEGSMKTYNYGYLRDQVFNVYYARVMVRGPPIRQWIGTQETKDAFYDAITPALLGLLRAGTLRSLSEEQRGKFRRIVIGILKPVYRDSTVVADLVNTVFSPSTKFRVNKKPVE